MENERDTQNNKIEFTDQLEPSKEDGASGSSHHHSSGETGSSHHSSHSHSGSSHSSGHSSSRHSSSGRSSSSRSSSNHRSSKSKHRRHSDREKITFANRMKRFRHTVKSSLHKYKPKYLYRKFSRRFKKASLQKKIGYVVLMITFFIAVGLFTKFALVDNLYPDSNTISTEKTTRTRAPVKPVVPKVKAAYELNDPESGFLVRLPVIESDSAAVAQINADIDSIKEEMKAKYKQAGTLDTITTKYDYSFSSFSNNSIVFISLYKIVEQVGGASDVSHTYYVYNYIDDRLVTDYSLTSVYNYNEMQMLEIINDKLNSIGSPQIDSTEGLEFSVNKEGKLCAQLLVNDGSGGKGPILVPLS